MNIMITYIPTEKQWQSYNTDRAKVSTSHTRIYA